MTQEIVLNPQEKVTIKTLGDAGRLVVTLKSRKVIEIVNSTEPVPGGGTPPPSGANLILNGCIKDASGAPSLEYWEQEPGKVWFNTHTVRPDSPSGCPAIQGDTDENAPGPWPKTFPSTAWIETVTAGNQPSHSALKLGWETAHHMIRGTALWHVFARNAETDPWTAIGVLSIVEGVPGDKSSNTVAPKTIAVPPGGFRQYKLRALVTLADPLGRDGVIFTAINLTLA